MMPLLGLLGTVAARSLITHGLLDAAGYAVKSATEEGRDKLRAECQQAKSDGDEKLWKSLGCEALE